MLIDLDSQANASKVLARDTFSITITDVLLGDYPATDAIVNTTQNNLWLLPGAESFASFAVRAKDVNEAVPQLVMRERLKDLTSFEFVVLDTAASLDLTVVNALTFADEVWVPVETSSFAVDAIHGLATIVGTLRSNFQETTIALAGVFMTLVNPQTISFRDVGRHLQKHFPQQICRTYISRAEDIKYALSRHQSIYAYAPESLPAQQYSSLTREIIAYAAQSEQRVQQRIG